ncbi:MAG: leucyl/phenylalanyl-tRNA--protein transferase [Saprospiraceae bacterium]|nr:leucyl/phenylalanyl-tRNA--protein transferase [Saprospiraceae bacterium]
MYHFLDEHLYFPHPEVVKSSGILAVGGDLSVDRLLLSYHYGIFPWYNDNEPVIWWCPKPRFVIYPEKVKVARSMKSYFNQNKFKVTYNTCFREIITHCRHTPRQNQGGTWINEDMINAYIKLHKSGYAMSVEVWEGKELAGGLYGVILGKVFFGESMFSIKNNASKFGFITLAGKLFKEGFYLIDCQQPNPHLESLGGEFITGNEFQTILRKNRMEWLCYV